MARRLLGNRLRDVRAQRVAVRRGDDRSGQSLAEFAIVFPILFLLLAAVIQFGLIFWTQNTLTQIARDTGRYAATQQVCNTGAARTDILNTAKSIAAASSLLGYNGSWTSPANVSVTWNGSPCPPVGNQQVVFVHITINHTAPVFFTFLPISGNLSTDAEFRMEPVAE